MKRLFFGGIHPRSNKEMSVRNHSFREITPERIYVPLQQHIGSAATPLVKVGDRVLKNQKIGDGEGMSVPVHASVAGRVVSIGMHPHPTLGKAMAIEIENDHTEEAVPPAPPATIEAAVEAIHEAGVVGLGGAAFPGSIKALSAIGKIDTFIANACECEPYITADDVLLRVKPERALDGMKILAYLLKAERACLAIEDNKTEAIEKIRSVLDQFPKIELVILPTRYPQGAEKQLVQAITGREIPPGQLPASVGCAVFNIASCAAVYSAVREGLPLTKRVVTVSGEAVNEPQNFIVRIGTPIYDLIEAAGGLHDKTERIITGGPMMGIAQTDLTAPVVKATNSILCLLKDENGAAENPVCLRCGKCASVCPMLLQPLYMYRFVNAGRTDELMRLHVSDCIECGSCAYTCPGKLPLVEKFRLGKKMVREANAK